MPIKKGEHYVQWNLFGPDFQFSIKDDLGVGIMTSWLGIPLIGTIKKNWNINEKVNVAVGALAGSFTWYDIQMFGALPFGAMTFGNRQRNLSISGGYGFINLPENKYIGNGQWAHEIEGRALTSISGMVKIASNLSLVFESFIAIPKKTRTVTELYPDYYSFRRDIVRTVEKRYPGFSLIVPGIRWHVKEGRSFQFGFAGIINDGEMLPVPIPMVQLYQTI